jgi:hypothetical protein
MNRKEFLSFALGILLLGLGFSAEAQKPPKVYRIGYLVGVLLPLTPLVWRHFDKDYAVSVMLRART